jgi:hypothetical protein
MNRIDLDQAEMCVGPKDRDLPLLIPFTLGRYILPFFKRCKLMQRAIPPPLPSSRRGRGTEESKALPVNGSISTGTNTGSSSSRYETKETLTENAVGGLPETVQVKVFTLKDLERKHREGKPLLFSNKGSIITAFLSSSHGGRRKRLVVKRCGQNRFFDECRRIYIWGQFPGSLKRHMWNTYDKSPSQWKNHWDNADSIAMSWQLAMCDQEITYKMLDRVSVLCVLQSFFGREPAAEKRKAWQKAFRKAFLEKKEFPPIPEEWVNVYRHPVSVIKQEGYCESSYLRVCEITQTRASGLAGPKTIANAISKFRRVSTLPNVRTWQRSHIHNMLNRFDSLAAIPAIKLANKAKISLNDHACVERGISEGGKTAALQDIDTLFKECHVDLETGVETEAKGQPLGERLFYKICSIVKRRPASLLNGNLFTVREPGKARVAINGTIARSEFLQPWSHVLLEWLSAFVETRSGVKMSRHLWNLYTSMGDKEEVVYTSWIMKASGLVFDLESASDYGNLLLAEDIIDWIQQKFSFPTWYADHVKYLLCAPYRVHINGIYTYTTSRGWPMGQPGTKVILTLAGAIAYMAAEYPVESIYRVVGDNNVVVSTSVSAMHRHLEQIQILDLKIGENDSVISDWAIYSCEEAIMLPKNFTNLWQNIRKMNITSMSLPYLDYPRVRLLNTVSKDRENFSDTNLGKLNLFFKEKNRYVEEWKKPLSRCMYVYATWFIDTMNDCRGLAQWLPSRMGGVGRTPARLDWKELPVSIRPIFSELGRDLSVILPDVEYTDNVILIPRWETPFLKLLDQYRCNLSHEPHGRVDSYINIYENETLEEFQDYLVKTPSELKGVSYLPKDFVVTKSKVIAEKSLCNKIELLFEGKEVKVKGQEVLEDELMKYEFRPFDVEYIEYAMLFLNSKRKYLINRIGYEQLYWAEVMDEIHKKTASLHIRMPLKFEKTKGLLERLRYEERSSYRLVQAMQAERKGLSGLLITLITSEDVRTNDPLISEACVEAAHWTLRSKETVGVILITDDKKLFEHIKEKTRSCKLFAIARVPSETFLRRPFDNYKGRLGQMRHLFLIRDHGSLEAAELSQAVYEIGDPLSQMVPLTLMDQELTAVESRLFEFSSKYFSKRS